ncbi:YbaB/EbfC family nucleoid-associated protein [Nonomuraea sp. SBT364]|uniref:YbaB/EbfC family nucleoid-associated protein n=1 Tax=Nonomuraea sp. SBT364 TaxID=1580530 RepID=UPI00069F852A|nr:YbaB/EbfC family nucleoid-associated protein [Nonomuraea sp. SBT364]
MPNPTEDRLYLDQVAEQTRTAMRHLREAQRQIAAVEGTGEAAQGMIKAVADGRGALTSVELNPRALRLDVARLGAEVTAAIQAAQDDAARRTGDILADAAGVAGALPEPLDERFVRDRVESAARELYAGEL